MPSVAWSASVACPYWRRPSSSFTFLVLTFFFRGLSCRSVNRTAGKAKKEMLKILKKNWREKGERLMQTKRINRGDRPSSQWCFPVMANHGARIAAPVLSLRSQSRWNLQRVLKKLRGKNLLLSMGYHFLQSSQNLNESESKP